MSDPNPIAQRLESLREQWRSFGEDDRARLLIWRATPDEASLIDSFVARECDADRARTPDLFVQLDAPFRSERAHGFALTHALCAQYEAAVVSFDPAHRVRRWHCPRIDERAADLAVLGATLASFRQHHADDDARARLVVWLDPSDVAAPDAYLRWLARAVQQADEALRFLVVDSVESARFHALAEAQPTRVVSLACALDMPSAFVSLVSSSGHGRGAGPDPAGSEARALGTERDDAGAPGDQLRRVHTELAICVEAADLVRAEALAACATELATTAGWPHLAASVQMMLAAGYGLAQRHVDAHGAYHRAALLAQSHEAALENTPAAEPGGRDDALLHARQLRLQAKLGAAAVLLTLRSYERAAETYLEATALAHALADARLELDGYRLASVCLALQREPTRAWQTGMRGLQLGLGLDSDTRQTSTLPYLADHLLRLSETHSEYRGHERPLAKQLARLLGDDWRLALR